MKGPRLVTPENHSNGNTGNNTTAKITDLLKKAEHYRKQQRFDLALPGLNQVLELNPNLVVAFIKRARIYLQTGENEKALADLNRAIELDPDNARVYSLRGSLYRLLKRPVEGLDDLNRALALKPDEPQALGERGTIYRNTGHFSLALADYYRALELDPTNTWLLGNLAETFRHLGEYRKAINNYTEVLALDPGQTWVFERRGYVYLRLGYLEKAQQDFEKSGEANQRNGWARWLAEWVKMCRRGFTFTPDMETKLTVLAHSATEGYETALYRSSLHWLKGEFLHAYREAEIATTLEPARPEAPFWKGMAAARLEKEEALACFQTSLDLKLIPILLGPANSFRHTNPAFFEVFESRFFHRNNVSPAPDRPQPPAGFLPDFNIPSETGHERLFSAALSNEEPRVSTGGTNELLPGPKVASNPIESKEPEQFQDSM